MTACAFPCKLQRQDCLVGRELARQMMRLDGLHSQQTETEVRREGAPLIDDGSVQMPPAAPEEPHTQDARLSRFEDILTSYPPILEKLLLHLPTLSLLDLYHTSGHLRRFLSSYPLAWRTLSFRQLADDSQYRLPSSGSQSPDGSRGAGRINALDLLLRVILPFGTRLTRLDLDNTAVSGAELYSRVLDGRRGTLQHLSVRNCKNVSLKYHILPFLQMQVSISENGLDEPPLALKSLYVYRCRNHRRRPYLPSSLLRKDSDSQPTHQLITICYYLGIWTDTGWCTTPGPRCFRRRDYALGRVASDSNAEIWVPFDRLWRSQNFIGHCDHVNVLEDQQRQTREVIPCPPQARSNRFPNVRLWEQHEHGQGGEPLGCGISTSGEGKEVPSHLRKSHTTFVEGFKCNTCGVNIEERCEQCSIRLHCAGCRRTLCASCAFDKPLLAKRQKKTREETIVNALNALGTADVLPPLATGDIETKMSRRAGTRLWWVPGATRSPNNISEATEDDQGSESGEDEPTHLGSHVRPREPKITTKWCCQRLDFSGGGGLAFHSHYHQGADRAADIRAAPLPMGRGFEDPAFAEAVEDSLISDSNSMANDDEEKDDDGYPPRSTDPTDLSLRHRPRTRKIKPFDTMPFIEQAAREGPSWYIKTIPRNFCKPCFESPKWKVRCAFKDCQVSLCIEHDIKTLKVRQCGFRKLDSERRLMRYGRPLRLFYAKWKPVAMAMQKYDFRRGNNSSAEPSAEPHSASTTAAGVGMLQKPSALAALPHLGGHYRSQMSQAGKSSQERSASTDRSNPATLSLQKHRASRFTSHDDSLIASPRPRHPLAVAASAASAHTSAAASAGTSTATVRPSFTGCSRLFCLPPDVRLPSDTRPNCPAWEYLVKCTQCTIFVCYDCCGLEMGCSCSACYANPRKFLCPDCEGDWAIAEQVRRTTEELANRGEKWKAEDRGKRFWRCRLEEETTKPSEDDEYEGKTPEEVERARRELFRELPLLSRAADGDVEDDVYDLLADDEYGVFGVLEGGHGPLDDEW